MTTTTDLSVIRARIRMYGNTRDPCLRKSLQNKLLSADVLRANPHIALELFSTMGWLAKWVCKDDVLNDYKLIALAVGFDFQYVGAMTNRLRCDKYFIKLLMFDVRRGRCQSSAILSPALGRNIQAV